MDFCISGVKRGPSKSLLLATAASLIKLSLNVFLKSPGYLDSHLLFVELAKGDASRHEDRGRLWDSEHLPSCDRSWWGWWAQGESHTQALKEGGKVCLASGLAPAGSASEHQLEHLILGWCGSQAVKKQGIKFIGSGGKEGAAGAAPQKWCNPKKFPPRAPCQSTVCSSTNLSKVACPGNLKKNDIISSSNFLFVPTCWLWRRKLCCFAESKEIELWRVVRCGQLCQSGYFECLVKNHKIERILCICFPAKMHYYRNRKEWNNLSLFFP